MVALSQSDPKILELTKEVQELKEENKLLKISLCKLGAKEWC